MQIPANIVILASLYALVGCGYVLVYRVSRVLNLAHGELMLVGAYLLLSSGWLISGHPFAAIAISLALSLAMGVGLYLVLMRRMTGEQVFAGVLATIAIGILLRGLAVLIWTAQSQHPLQALGLSNPPRTIGGATGSTVGWLTVASTIVVYASLGLFFRYTRWGIRMRAVGENPLLAAQRGIRLDTVLAIAWGLATVTGALAGMLLACDSGLDGSMVLVGLKAFPVVLVGGLDSLPGALIGALIVAGAEVAAIQFVDPLLSEIVPFVVLLAMLLVRPWGLFGTKEELERV